jgi:hypothetical protein
LINTGPDTWKAKRIKGGSPAIVWIDDEMGPAFIGKAELTNESAAKNQINENYPRKIPVGTDRSSQALKCVLRLVLNEPCVCPSLMEVRRHGNQKTINELRVQEIRNASRLLLGMIIEPQQRRLQFHVSNALTT